MKKLFVVLLVLVSITGMWGQSTVEERYPEITSFFKNVVLMMTFYYQGDRVKVNSIMFDAMKYLDRHDNNKVLIDEIAEAHDARKESPISFILKKMYDEKSLPDYYSETEWYFLSAMVIASLCYENASLGTIVPDLIAVFANREIAPILEEMNIEPF